MGRISDGVHIFMEILIYELRGRVFRFRPGMNSDFIDWTTGSTNQLSGTIFMDLSFKKIWVCHWRKKLFQNSYVFICYPHFYSSSFTDRTPGSINQGDPEIRLWGLQTDMEACFWPKNSETSFWKLSLYKLVDWSKTKYNNHSCINPIFMGGYLRIWASKDMQHKKNLIFGEIKKHSCNCQNEIAKKGSTTWRKGPWMIRSACGCDRQWEVGGGRWYDGGHGGWRGGRQGGGQEGRLWGGRWCDPASACVCWLSLVGGCCPASSDPTPDSWWSYSKRYLPRHTSYRTKPSCTIQKHSETKLNRIKTTLSCLATTSIA